MKFCINFPMIMYLKNCNLDEFMVHEVIKNNFRLMENLRTVAEKDHYACKSITSLNIYHTNCFQLVLFKKMHTRRKYFWPYPSPHRHVFGVHIKIFTYINDAFHFLNRNARACRRRVTNTCVHSFPCGVD